MFFAFCSPSMMLMTMFPVGVHPGLGELGRAVRASGMVDEAQRGRRRKLEQFVGQRFGHVPILVMAKEMVLEHMYCLSA
jgi:hypothetical protein